MNNKNSQNKLSTCLLKKVYYQKSLLLQGVNYKNKGERKNLSEIYKKQGEKANAKEKNLNEIYSKQGKRQGQKKNLSNDGKKKPKQWPVNFLRQIETFEWIHVCFGPRISRLYDSHLDE